MLRTVLRTVLWTLASTLSCALAADAVPQDVAEQSRGLDAPFEPTDHPVLDVMFDMVRPRADDFLIDLGSGDGRIPIEAARRFGLRGLGVDLNEELVAISRARAQSAGVDDQVSFLVQDLFRTDIRPASILAMYLLPAVMMELREAMLRELRPGTRIVAHDYHLQDWRPDDIRSVPTDAGESVVYLWIVPAEVVGWWQWWLPSLDGRGQGVEFEVELTQRFQDIGVQSVLRPQHGVLHDFRLEGDRISFSAAAEMDYRQLRLDYSGTVNGDAISGLVKVIGAAAPVTLPWSAHRIRDEAGHAGVRGAAREPAAAAEPLQPVPPLQSPPRAGRALLEWRLREAANAMDQDRYGAALNAVEAVLAAAADEDDPLRASALELQQRAVEANAIAPEQVLASLAMTDIPGGKFRMGHPQGYRDGRERAVRDVSVAPFRLGRFPITFEQYDRYCNAARLPCPDDRGHGRGDRPVVNVNWYDVQGFVRWLNDHGGRGFRLPTEAEWEYAARAGSTTDFPWGDAMLPGRANCLESQCRDGFSNASPVGALPENAFGLHDMHGNVWEWVQDCWNGGIYDGAPTDGEARLTGDCSRRVLRGGSWNRVAHRLRSSSRDWSDASLRWYTDGFRLAQDP